MESEWNGSLLSDIADVVDSLHKTPKYSDTGYPMVRCVNLRYGVLKLSNTLSVSEEIFTEYSAKYTPKLGDIIITRVGANFGVTSYVVDTNFCLGQNTAAIAAVKINPRYLYYIFNSVVGRQQMDVLVAGAAQPTLSLKAIRNLIIPRFGDESEDKIAHILGSLDDKIELNRRMNVTLEGMAQALFKSWFVDFDPVIDNALAAGNPIPDEFADRAKVRRQALADGTASRELASMFPNSFHQTKEANWIPEGWKEGDIGNLCHRVLDKIKSPAEWASDTLIDLSRMPSKSISLENWGLGKQLTSSVTRFRKMDTLFGAIRPYFHKVGIAPTNGVTNVSVFVIRSNQEADKTFVATLCSMDYVVNYATNVSKGTKMPVVAWPDFARCQVYIPPVKTREAFGKRIGDSFDRIIKNIEQSLTLSNLRETLLPKLISGELRISEAEQLTEEALA